MGAFFYVALAAPPKALWMFSVVRFFVHRQGLSILSLTRKIAAKPPGLWTSSPIQSKRKQPNSKRPAAGRLSSTFCESLKSLPEMGGSRCNFRDNYWGSCSSNPPAQTHWAPPAKANVPIGRQYCPRDKAVYQSCGKGLNFGRTPACDDVAATRSCGRSRFIPKACKFLLNCLENQ